MRHMSAASAKRGLKYRRQDGPRPNTKIAELFAVFSANKGRVIEWSFHRNHHQSLDYLRDVYGLDIINIARGKWCLAGEWFGTKYVDYVAALHEGNNEQI